MGLVGRDAELERLRRAVDAVRAGEPTTLGIFGDAGIGKSALLTELAELSKTAGFDLLEGVGAEHERDVPFGVVVDALDERVAAIGPRRLDALQPVVAAVLPAVGARSGVALAEPAGPAERFRYHRALRAVLEDLARERPVALVLDDLHWADAASVEFVLHLLRRPVTAPLLLVFALRPVDPMPRLLDAARSLRSWDALWLEPLDHGTALELLGRVDDPRLKEQIAREAAGNPLYLEELARGADRVGALPRTLLAAVGQELAALPPASRALLEGAAVAGDPFDLELAAAAADLPADEVLTPVDRLVAADIVRATGDRRAFRFRHPLVHRAVYDSAPAGWRLAAHERVAEQLAERGAPPSQRAFHIEHAAQPGDQAAIDVLQQAASEAIDAAPASAARWYAAALALLRGDEPATRATLAAGHARALAAAGRLEKACEAYSDAVRSDVSGARIALLRERALVERALGRHADARASLELALSEAPAGSAAEVALELAGSAWHAGDHDQIAVWCERTMALAGDDEVVRGGAEALAAVVAQWDGDTDAAADLIAAAERRITGAPPTAAHLDVGLSHLAAADLMMDRFPEARATSERATEVARASGRNDLVLWFGLVTVSSAMWTLDLDAADRHLELCEEMSRSLGIRSQLSWILWVRAWYADVTGDPSEFTRATREFADLEREVENTLYLRAGRRFLAVLEAETDPERGIEQLLELSDGRPETASPTTSTVGLHVLTRCAIAAGRFDEARDYADRCSVHAAAHGYRVGRVRALCALGEVELAGDDPARALELAREAVTTAKELGARLDEVAASILLGRALAAAGDRAEAESVLQAVAAQAAGAGALKAHAEAARELRRIGARVTERVRREVAASDTELTPREREIAELVAAGRTNKEVGQALFLSEKTIEHNLSRIYVKLSVRSRRELPAALGVV